MISSTFTIQQETFAALSKHGTGGSALSLLLPTKNTSALLPCSVEGQVSRSDERYLYLSRSYVRY
jgi:hypothetical protein